MRRLCTLVACSGLLTMACAIFGGGMPIRVSGMVPELTPGVARTDCELALVQASTEQVRSRREISAAFSLSFVIEARPKAYYFIAECRDGRKFRSQEVVLGSQDTFNQLFELELIPEDEISMTGRVSNLANG